MTNNAQVIDIIRFTVNMNPNGIFRPGFNFRGWKYVIMKMRYSSDGEESDISPDSGCGVTLGDRAYL